MKILHTSDWHLGRALYGKKRYPEFEAFLSWMLQTIQEQQIETLIIAGDIFDSSVPTHRSQEMYYQFLYQLTLIPCCRHIIIVAGNHDSPTLLNAPKDLLKALNIYVISTALANIEEQIIVLNNTQKQPEMIICAVPYLRERDVRKSEAGEGVTEKEEKLQQGIRQHYQQIAALAEQKRQSLNPNIPIIATGHLFAAGGTVVDGDGVRELYIGKLGRIGADIFSDSFNYVALGHLHSAQIVGGKEHIRYSGSPIAMGFGEAKKEKSVTLVNIDSLQLVIEKINVPVFQELYSIVGNLLEIKDKLSEFKLNNKNIWVDITYNGNEVITDLREQLENWVKGTDIIILKMTNKLVFNQILKRKINIESLDDLDHNEVFERRLQSADLSDEQKNELINTYSEIKNSYDEAKRDLAENK